MTGTSGKKSAMARLPDLEEKIEMKRSYTCIEQCSGRFPAGKAFRTAPRRRRPDNGVKKRPCGTNLVIVDPCGGGMRILERGGAARGRLELNPANREH